MIKGTKGIFWRKRKEKKGESDKINDKDAI